MLRPDAMLEAVERFAREGLAAYKCPRRFIAVPAMPKTPVGKIIKAELALLAQGSIESIDTFGDGARL